MYENSLTFFTFHDQHHELLYSLRTFFSNSLGKKSYIGLFFHSLPLRLWLLSITTIIMIVCSSVTSLCITLILHLQILVCEFMIIVIRIMNAL